MKTTLSRHGSRSLAMTSALAVVACGQVGCENAAKPSPPSAPSQNGQAATNADEGRSAADSSKETSLADEALTAALNRAIGLLGRFEFEAAEATLLELDASLAAKPESDPFRRLVRRALGIVRMNQTSEGSQQRAIEIFQPLLKEDPNDLVARYCMGISYLFLGEPAEALPHFEAVAKARPHDAYALYYLGQCYEFDDQYDKAAESYLRAADQDRYLRSPLLGLQRIAAKQALQERSDRYLKEFQALAGNPQARLAEFKYTRMGELAEVRLPPAPVGSDPTEDLATLVERAATLVVPPEWFVADPTNVTAADVDGDGLIDLCVAGARADGRLGVLRATGDFAFAADEASPLGSVTAVRTVLWGDIDNDGDVDAYLCRAGPNQLLMGDGHGGFQPAPEKAGVDGGDVETVDGAIADLDHDGDLDLFLCQASGPAQLLSNNGDGTFREIASTSGAAGDGRPTRRVVVNDFDGDRDADLLLIHAAPPNELLVNDRLWRYQAEASPWPLATMPLEGAVATDADADGNLSVLAVSTGGEMRVVSRLGDAWSPVLELGNAGADAAGAHPLALADLVCRGGRDIVMVEKHRVVVRGVDGKERVHANLAPATAAGGTWTILESATQGPLVAIVGRTGLTFVGAGPERGRFASVRFTGRIDPSLAMRSNASGIGTRFAARMGKRWCAGDTFRATSGPGQSLQPISIGLGRAEHIDFVSMDWSDGVFQTELDLDAGKEHVIVEAQRQISSCPVLFVWDGERYQFVTDALGVGGIGYLLAPGEYAPPRPFESLLLPAELKPAVSEEGLIEMRLGEPMEEACYLDQARLFMVDLPPGWSMTIDERMGMAGPEVTGEPRFYRESILPLRVNDERGRDWTERARQRDGEAIPQDEVDRDLIGYLRTPRTITITFERPLDQLPGTPTLVMDGWVEYPYCQTNFAAWQRDVAAQAPDLEALGADGTWHRVYPSWGYPAGMPRECSLPLIGLPEGAKALRFTSNQEIYWDRFTVVGVEACPEARVVELPLARASVAEAGFPERVPHPEKRPDYRYERRVPLWDTRHQAGFYTAVGDCRELLAESDDALAIFGPGEEVRIGFSVSDREPVHSLSDGLSRGERRFILSLRGWCKDLDLFTRDGASIEPLPSRGTEEQTSPTRDALHRRHNIRYRDGRS